MVMLVVGECCMFVGLVLCGLNGISAVRQPALCLQNHTRQERRGR
jgi:hypothetical protein